MLALGIPIGFYSYLFPGTINVMLMTIYNDRKTKTLVLLLLLALLFEAFYCIASIKLFSVLNDNTQLQFLLNVTADLLLFGFGISMLCETKTKKVNTQSTINRGLLSIIIHPQQIPFWLVFSKIVNSNTPLYGNNSSILLFALFNCLGVLIVFYSYMLLGNKLMKFFKVNLNMWNNVLGVVYITLSIYNLSTLIF